MLKRLLLAGLATAAMVTVAQAADIIEEPAAFDWSGPYVGLQLGYAWGNYELQIESESFEEDLDGIVGGGHVGWLFQHESLVFGIEGDIEAADLDGSIDVEGLESDVDIGLLGSARARLGWALDNVLVYATGGVAFADMDYDTYNIGADVSDENSDTFIGYTVGGGIEVGVSENVSARIEYRYTDLGSKTFEPDGFGDPFHVDLDFHAVRGGVSWHF